MTIRMPTFHDADDLTFFEPSILADSILELFLQIDEDVVVGDI